MIASFCPGRVRLRFKELKNKAAAGQAVARIKEEAGITKVEVNTLTGSILIEYDTNILSVEKFMEIGRRELAKLNIPVE